MGSYLDAISLVYIEACVPPACTNQRDFKRDVRERGKGEKVIQKSRRLAKHQQRLCITLRLYDEPGSICMFKRQFACISEEGSPPDGVSILQVSRSVFRESFPLVPTARPFLIPASRMPPQLVVPTKASRCAREK